MRARTLWGASDHFHRVACWRSGKSLACCVLRSRFNPTVGSYFFKNFCSVSVRFLYNFSIVICHLFSLTSNSLIICVRWRYNVLFSCERYGFNVIGRYDICPVLFTTARGQAVNTRRHSRALMNVSDHVGCTHTNCI